MDPQVIGVSATAESEITSATKAASVVSRQTWALPKVEDESRQVQQQRSLVEDGERQGAEMKTNLSGQGSTSKEHILPPEAVASPRVNESVEHTFHQFVEEQTSEEPVIMDETTSLIYNSNKQAASDGGQVKKVGDWFFSRFGGNPACCAGAETGDAFVGMDTDFVGVDDGDINKEASIEHPPEELITKSLSQASVKQPVEKPVSKAPEKPVVKAPEQPVSKAPVKPSQKSEKQVVEKVQVVENDKPPGKGWTTKKQKKKSLLKRLSKRLTGKKKSKKSRPQTTTTQEKTEVIVDEPATLKPTVTEEGAVSIKPSGSKTASVVIPEVASMGKASSSLMDKVDDEVEIVAEELPVKKNPLSLATILNFGACSVQSDTPRAFIVDDSSTLKSTVTDEAVDAIKRSDSKTASEVASVGKASSSLMDKDEEDEIDVEAKHLDAKRKPLSLANILSVGGACSVKPDTPAGFNVDQVKSDGFNGGFEKAGDDSAAPKGLFTCGVVPTSPRKGGIFDGLTSVQSDAAVGVTTDIDDDEIKELTKQTRLSSIGEENATKVQTKDSKESEQQQRTLSPTPDRTETKVKEGDPQHQRATPGKANKSISQEDQPRRRVAPVPEKKEIKIKKSKSNEDKPPQRAELYEMKKNKLKKSKPTEDKPRQRAETSEKRETTLQKSKSKEDKPRQRADTSETNEIKLKKSKSQEDKPQQRADTSEIKEIKLKKSKSKEDKPRQRAETSEKKETALKKSKSKEEKPRQRASPTPEKSETKVEKTMKKPAKPHHQDALVSQMSSDTPLGKPSRSSELNEMLEVTETSSSSLLGISSSSTDDTFVGHMEAKFDLYNEKYGLIQKFGNHLDELKKKQGKSNSCAYFG